jgi:hypothetical protein
MAMRSSTINKILINHVMRLQVLFTSENGQCQKTFYPFSGVHEELKAFVHDIVQASKVCGTKPFQFIFLAIHHGSLMKIFGISF